MNVQWTVYTKPWMRLGADELGDLVNQLGFDSVEVPVRAGAVITAENCTAVLPQFVRSLNAAGIAVTSCAGPATVEMIRACGRAGVPRLRIMLALDGRDYSHAMTHWRDHLGTLSAACAAANVQICLQPHHGAWIPTTAGVLNVLRGLPPEWFSLAWDAAHDALAGEFQPSLNLDLAATRLSIINLKNAVYAPVGNTPHAAGAPMGPGPVSAPEATLNRFRPRFVPADAGMADWARIVEWIRGRRWSGPVCLTSEYSTDQGPATGEVAARLVAADLRSLRALVAAEVTA